jgi:hypothetical protein
MLVDLPWNNGTFSLSQMSRGSWLALPWREILCKSWAERSSLQLCHGAANIHRIKGRIKSNDVAPHVELSFASRGHLLAEEVWVQLSSGFSCKVSAIESWLSIVEPQPRMGFSPNDVRTERRAELVRAMLRWSRHSQSKYRKQQKEYN